MLREDVTDGAQGFSVCGLIALGTPAAMLAARGAHAEGALLLKGGGHFDVHAHLATTWRDAGFMCDTREEFRRSASGESLRRRWLRCITGVSVGSRAQLTSSGCFIVIG